MKKFILIGGVVYTVISLGVGIYWLTHPEAYGAYVGRYINGMTSIVTKED